MFGTKEGYRRALCSVIFAERRGKMVNGCHDYVKGGTNAD